MTRRSYATDATTWRGYQPHLPADLRLDRPDRAPREEWWEWDGWAIHLDRLDGGPATATGHGRPTVIICHGGGGYGRLLAPLGVPLRAAGYDVVLPDLPGFGLSTRGPGDRRPLRYDDHWVRLVADLAIAEHARSGRPVALFGLSMGGMLALHAAAAAPAGTVAAVLATTLMDPRDPATRRAVARLPGTGVTLPLLRAAPRVRVPMPWLAKMSAMSSIAAVNRLCARDPQGGGTRAPLGFLHSWLTYDPPVEPGAFDRCPVLLMHPGADRWTPAAISDAVLDRLTVPTRRVVLERCEHFPVESPGADTLHRESLALLAERLPTAATTTPSPPPGG